MASKSKRVLKYFTDKKETLSLIQQIRNNFEKMKASIQQSISVYAAHSGQHIKYTDRCTPYFKMSEENVFINKRMLS